MQLLELTNVAKDDLLFRHVINAYSVIALVFGFDFFKIDSSAAYQRKEIEIGLRKILTFFRISLLKSG